MLARERPAVDWTTLVALGLFGLACVQVAYRAAAESWSATDAAGPAAFLFGAGLGMFLDDLLAPGSRLQPWIEPVAAAIVLAGIVAWWRTGERGDSSGAASE